MHNLAAIHGIWSASPVRAETSRLARELGVEAYLVGGAVRDIALARAPHDWDVVSPQAIVLARAVAQRLKAAFVWLHDDPDTVRVVARDRVTGGFREDLDFAAYRAESLEADLRDRDFTINSLAWRIDAPGSSIIDPTSGLRDLARRVIRAGSDRVFADDPVRCMRAFRLGAELAFELDPDTVTRLSVAAPELAQMPGERVGVEFMRMLEHPHAANWLAQMDQAGVIRAILPEMLDLKGVRQGPHHHLDVWGHTLRVVQGIEEIHLEPGRTFPRTARLVEDYLAEPAVLARIKLAGLTHDIAKPAHRVTLEGRIRFIGHERGGAVVARRIADRLRLPRDSRSTVVHLTHEHMRPMLLAEMTEVQELTLSAIRRVFRDTDPDGIGLMVLAAADLQACRGPATSPAERAEKLAVLDDMLARYVEWEQSREFVPLLRGRDLIHDLALEPGPEFALILQQVEHAQVDGIVRTREQALALARRIAAEGVPRTDGEE